MNEAKAKMTSLNLRLLEVCFLTFVLSSCQSTANSGQQGNVSASYITANSYSELTKSVDTIVIGEMTAVGDSINIARDDKNITKTSSSRYEIGQIYEIKVEEYIKGDGASTIEVVQVEGFLSQKDPKNTETIQRARENFDFIPLQPGRKYMLFLSDLIGFPKGEYYIGSIHPWRFDISDPERVIPESPWEYANQVFPPVPLSQVLEQIKHPELDIIPPGKVGVYPAPGGSLQDKENSYPSPTSAP